MITTENYKLYKYEELPNVSGIYCLENNINKKRYIGQSQNIKERIRNHFKSNDNLYIHRAIQKYGKDNFNIYILEICELSELSELEIYYIKKFNALEQGYNLTEGGEGHRGICLTEEHKQAISEKNSKETWGYNFKEKWFIKANSREKMSELLQEKGYDINRFNISDAIRLRSYSKDFTFGNTKSEALEISNKIVPPEEVNIYLYNYKTDKYSELLFTYSDIEKYIRNNGYELSNGHAWSALHKNNKHIKDFIWGKTKEEIQKKLEESGLVTYVFYFPLNIILKFTESITEISNVLKERFDVYITRTAISKIKLGKQKQSKGFTFGNSLKQLINNIYNISIEQSKTILNLAKENNLLNSQELIEWQDQLNFISVDY